MGAVAPNQNNARYSVYLSLTYLYLVSNLLNATAPIGCKVICVYEEEQKSNFVEFADYECLFCDYIAVKCRVKLLASAFGLSVILSPMFISAAPE